MTNFNSKNREQGKIGCIYCFLNEKKPIGNNKISQASKNITSNYDIKEINYFNNKLAIVLPHPSPLNIKWFKDHPEFMEKRIFEIRKIINKVLEEK